MLTFYYHVKKFCLIGGQKHTIMYLVLYIMWYTYHLMIDCAVLYTNLSAIQHSAETFYLYIVFRSCIKDEDFNSSVIQSEVPLSLKSDITYLYTNLSAILNSYCFLGVLLRMKIQTVLWYNQRSRSLWTVTYLTLVLAGNKLFSSLVLPLG